MDVQTEKPPSPNRTSRVPSHTGLAWGEIVEHAGLLGSTRLACLAATGVGATIALHASLASFASFVAVVSAVTTLTLTIGVPWLGPRRLVEAPQVEQRRELIDSHYLLAAATVISTFLIWRASPSLATINWLTIGGLLGLAALLARDTEDQYSLGRLGELLRRGLRFLLGPLILGKSLAALSPRGTVVLRGLVIALIPLLILGALLASADAVFASLFAFDLHVSALVRHTLIAGLVACALAGVTLVARTEPRELADAYRPMGETEASVVLGAISALLGVFSITQLVGVAGAADHILETAGLTRAEYAREGFFQLLAAAVFNLAIVGGVQLVVRHAGVHGRRTYRLLVICVCILTFVLVVVSLVRLELYIDAFGLTLPRWYSIASLILVGTILALVAAGFATNSRWVTKSIVASLVAVVITVNVMNPEARIVSHNLGQVGSGAELDADYLLDLSADAWPQLLDEARIVGNVAGSQPGFQRSSLARRCYAATKHRGFGIASFNLSRYRVDCDRLLSSDLVDDGPVKGLFPDD